MPQTVEPALVAAYYAMVTRMLATLEVDVEPEYQGYLDRFPLGQPDLEARELSRGGWRRERCLLGAIRK